MRVFEIRCRQWRWWFELNETLQQGTTEMGTCKQGTGGHQLWGQVGEVRGASLAIVRRKTHTPPKLAHKKSDSADVSPCRI